MKKTVFVIFFSFVFSNIAWTQRDSCAVQISLLTCAPGEELYSTFGHTALRVKDSVTGSDLIFNYGTFEFGPDFYTKFIRGKLLYFLSVEQFEDFLYQYQAQSRSVVEQVLNLTCEEKQNMLTALRNNSTEANRYYRYDFLYDNCTTRARDITGDQTSSAPVFKNILPEEVPSFRDLIHSYLDAGHQPWSKLGIDMLLGVKLDKKVTNEEAMFLPDYLLKGFDSAAIAGRPLVQKKQTILQMPSPLEKGSVFTPLLVFSLIFLVVFVMSLSSKPVFRKIIAGFDLGFFMLLGLAGILLLFMWFGTDHIVCRNNYNLLWALPTHLVASFFVFSRKSWKKTYWKFVALFTVVLLAAWFFLPQEMNPALLPILLLIIFRSWHHSKKESHA